VAVDLQGERIFLTEVDNLGLVKMIKSIKQSV